MQEVDNKILTGNHKSLSSDILDASILASDREMSAKSVTRHAGEDLTHSLLLKGGSNYEQLHDHLEYHRPHATLDHTTGHNLEHDYHQEIVTQIRQTRALQHEYHQEMERQQERQISINNDININY